MLTFVVPVKSRVVSTDWLKFCKLFERTLISICGQTDTNFKVVIVCHEIPKIEYTNGNINIFQVDFQPPSLIDSEPKENLIKQRIDKGKKIKLGVEFARRRFNTDYVMTVDSDDFVSNRIAAFVNQSGNFVPGWYVNNGYLHFNWKLLLIVTRKFSYLCGSSIIVKPALIKHFFDADKITLYFDHRLKVLNGDIELSKFPFYAGIYSIANGENLFMSFQNVKKLNDHGNWLSLQSIKRICSKIKNYNVRLITPKLRKEFNFYLP